MANKHFGDKLIKRIRDLGHPLCVGLDPYLDRIPPPFRIGSMAPTDEQTTRAVGGFLTNVIDRIQDKVAIIKPQSAFFEFMGWRGIQLLEQIVQYAKSKGIMVLMDVKRGDIGTTSAIYASTYLSNESPLGGDAVTVNPYLGKDTLQPYFNSAQINGLGLFVLIKTSNVGSGDYQDLKIGKRTFFETIAKSLGRHTIDLCGSETGWSSLGIVVGATYPKQAEALRQILPNSLFLIPGYGAQGANADDTVVSFVPGPEGHEGGIVNSSRAILFPTTENTGNISTWEKAFDHGLDQAIDGLREALARRK